MTAPYAPPPRSWRTRLREVVTERLGLKAIALLLSVLLWLVVQARKPTSRGYGDARTAPETDSARRAPSAGGERAATAADGAGRSTSVEVGSRDAATKSLTPAPAP
jgi:hypothetical protein